MPRTSAPGSSPSTGRASIVESGLLTFEQVELVLAEQERSKRPLSTTLLDLGIVSEEDIPRVLALWNGLEVVDLRNVAVDPTAASLVPESMARRHTMIPIRLDGNTIVVAVADPLNVVLVDDLRIRTGRGVRLVVAPRRDIDEVISRIHALNNAELVEAPSEQEIADEAEQEARIGDAPNVRIVHGLIADAVAKRASDVHIEPEERDVRVRFRIDGVLHDIIRVPKGQQAGIISRIKVMADANIAERRMPQDGRISLVADHRAIDLRIATLPSVYGEDVIIRILDRTSSLRSLEDLGYSPQAYERYEEAIQRTSGLILVTGPTGSGKSTTLYGSLNQLNDPAKKIVTVEDPVEYRLPGLRQVQVHPEIGLTFARSLRAILRSDPDIVMIGEIRDPETATIAIHAAMTGHLVLATLHTNDAASAVTRLIDMGVEPFLVSSALRCVMAQRLARRLCAHCAVSEPIDERREALAIWEGSPPRSLSAPVGCRECAGTGFHGRIAVAETMPISDEIARLAADRRPTHDIESVALVQGMTTLKADAVNKARAGVTTIDEALRVVS